MSQVRYCSYCGQSIGKSSSRRVEVGKKRLIVHLKCFEQFYNQIKLNKIEELKEIQEKQNK